MQQFITAQKIFDGKNWHTNSALVLKNNKVEEITSLNESIHNHPDTQHFPDCDLVPGFIDTQVNGGGGIMLNERADPNALNQILKAHQRYGSTGMLPTLITDHPERMQSTTTALIEQVGTPGFLGVHIEGPHINPLRRGVHQAHCIRPFEDNTLKCLTSLRKAGLSVILTVAPELLQPGTIRQLTQMGICVAAGHTAATYDDICRALDEGLRAFTHLFNAMTPLANRDPGVVGAALDSDAWCGIIADGHHVHPATLRIALRGHQRRDRIILVTDAMATVGAPEKKFTLYGETIHEQDGRLISEEGKLAGSDLDMLSGFNYLCQHLSTEREQALAMASLYPAQMLDLPDTGHLGDGAWANFLLLNPNNHIQATWINGVRQFH